MTTPTQKEAEPKVLHEWFFSPAKAGRQRLVRGDSGPVYYEWCLGVPGHAWKRVDAPPAEVFMDALVDLAAQSQAQAAEIENLKTRMLARRLDAEVEIGEQAALLDEMRRALSEPNQILARHNIEYKAENAAQAARIAELERVLRNLLEDAGGGRAKPMHRAIDLLEPRYIKAARAVLGIGELIGGRRGEGTT